MKSFAEQLTALTAAGYRMPLAKVNVVLKR